MFYPSEQIIGKWDLSHSKLNNYKKASVKTDNPIKQILLAKQRGEEYVGGDVKEIIKKRHNLKIKAKQKAHNYS